MKYINTMNMINYVMFNFSYEAALIQADKLLNELTTQPIERSGSVIGYSTIIPQQLKAAMFDLKTHKKVGLVRETNFNWKVGKVANSTNRIASMFPDYISADDGKRIGLRAKILDHAATVYQNTYGASRLLHE